MKKISTFLSGCYILSGFSALTGFTFSDLYARLQGNSSQALQSIRYYRPMFQLKIILVGK